MKLLNNLKLPITYERPHNFLSLEIKYFFEKKHKNLIFLCVVYANIFLERWRYNLNVALTLKFICYLIRHIIYSFYSTLLWKNRIKSLWKTTNMISRFPNLNPAITSFLMWICIKSWSNFYLFNMKLILNYWLTWSWQISTLNKLMRQLGKPHHLKVLLWLAENKKIWFKKMKKDPIRWKTSKGKKNQRACLNKSKSGRNHNINLLMTNKL